MSRSRMDERLDRRFARAALLHRPRHQQHVQVRANDLRGLLAVAREALRGVAQARVAFEADDKKREAILREGVRDLLRRYPPK